MEEKNTHPFLLERAFDWLMAKAIEYRIPLLASLIFGMLAHGFAFTNKLLNHDEAYNLFGKGGSFSLGRWGLEICERFFPNFSMPWIYGLITVALVSVSVCIIVRMLRIQNKLLQILLAGIIVGFPSLTSVFTFMFTASSYGLSFFTAILAAWFIHKPTKFTVLPAIGCMVFSLSIYQAYIPLTAGILILYLIQELLLGADMMDVLRKGLVYVGFLALSMILYFAATQLTLILVGYRFSEYAQGSVDFSLAEIPHRISLAYQYFYRFLHWNNLALVPTDFSTRIHGYLMELLPLLFILCCVLRKAYQPVRILFLLALIGILPLASNSMYLLSPELAVHTLMVYGFVCLYIFAVMLADMEISMVSAKKLIGLLQRLGADVLAVILALILATNVYFANEAYLYQHIQYENLYSFYTSLTADIMMTPGFNEGTRLAVIGDYNPAYENFPPFFVEVLNGANSAYPSMYSNYKFMEYYIGFPIDFLWPSEIEVIKSTPEFTAMPVYPYPGSMQFIGDTLVVKLS